MLAPVHVTVFTNELKLARQFFENNTSTPIEATFKAYELCNVVAIAANLVVESIPQFEPNQVVDIFSQVHEKLHKMVHKDDGEMIGPMLNIGSAVNIYFKRTNDRMNKALKLLSLCKLALDFIVVCENSIYSSESNIVELAPNASPLYTDVMDIVAQYTQDLDVHLIEVHDECICNVAMAIYSLNTLVEWLDYSIHDHISFGKHPHEYSDEDINKNVINYNIYRLYCFRMKFEKIKNEIDELKVCVLDASYE